MELERLGQPKAEDVTHFPYKQIIGSLLYLITHTRPDMAYAVIFLSRFSTGFGVPHVHAVRQLLRYVASTREYGLVLGLPDKDGKFTVVAYADADYAMCADTSRSTTGNLVLSGGSAVNWKVQRQSVVAQSTMEAEYMALAHACREVIWLRFLFEQLGMPIKGPTEIREDNEAARRLANNPEFHELSKHIAVKYHLTRDMVENGTVVVTSVRTQHQLADIFTKPLASPIFLHLRNAIGVRMA